MITNPDDILNTIRSIALIYCEFNVVKFIAKPREFLGSEIKLISLKKAYKHALIMVMIFIDDDDVNCY